MKIVNNTSNEIYRILQAQKIISKGQDPQATDTQEIHRKKISQ